MKVAGDMVGKHSKRAPHEAGHTIGVPTSTAALNEVTMGKDAGGAAAQGRGMEGQSLHGMGEAGESVDTGPALSCRLTFEIGDHPTHLGERADLRGQQCHHPGADRRAMFPSRFFGERHHHGIGHGHPSAPVSAEQEALRESGATGRQAQYLLEREAEWRLDDPRFGPETGHREQGSPR